MLATNIDKQRVAPKEVNRTTFTKVPEEHTVVFMAGAASYI